MIQRFALAVFAAALLMASPALAMPQTLAHLELTQMMGRWYEIARLPNSIQKGCQAGASDWTRASDGFSVVQSCHKGAPDGPISLWKAKARVADPATNAKFKMTFFGGLVSQEYWVLDRRDAEGWLILSTHDGKYLWLMSQRPTLSAGIRSQVVTRIRQLGFDPARLEWPAPARS